VKDLSKISLVTYTNLNCHDILRPHIGQIDKFASKFKSHIFTDGVPDFGFNKDRHQISIYDDSEPYYKQWLTCLDNVEEDYIIYLQEDFWLFDHTDYSEILRCKKFLDESDYSFVRLAKYDLRLGMHRPKSYKIKDFPDVRLDDNIFDAYCHDSDCYSFMMQATLWKKKDFIKLYSQAKSTRIESPEWWEATMDCKIKGAFYHQEDMPKLGPWHWQSKTLPHISTAVGYGKWTLSVHGGRLLDIINEYGIDVKKRGTR